MLMTSCLAFKVTFYIIFEYLTEEICITYEQYLIEIHLEIRNFYKRKDEGVWRGIVNSNAMRLQFLTQEINVPQTFRLNLLDVGNVESAIRELPSFQSLLGELRRPGQALCRHRRRFCMTVAKIAKHQLGGSPC